MFILTYTCLKQLSRDGLLHILAGTLASALWIQGRKISACQEAGVINLCKHTYLGLYGETAEIYFPIISKRRLLIHLYKPQTLSFLEEKSKMNPLRNGTLTFHIMHY